MATGIFGWSWSDEGEEDMLQQMVANYGPISVRIDANHDSFKNYKGGQCLNIGLVVIVRLYIFF